MPSIRVKQLCSPIQCYQQRLPLNCGLHMQVDSNRITVASPAARPGGARKLKGERAISHRLYLSATPHMNLHIAGVPSRLSALFSLLSCSSSWSHEVKWYGSGAESTVATRLTGHAHTNKSLHNSFSHTLTVAKKCALLGVEYGGPADGATQTVAAAGTPIYRHPST